MVIEVLLVFWIHLSIPGRDNGYVNGNKVCRHYIFKRCNPSIELVSERTLENVRPGYCFMNIGFRRPSPWHTPGLRYKNGWL